MNIQIRSDKQAVRVTLPAAGELTIPEAAQLARDLIDAATQCGYEVKMTVEVPRHQPTPQQIAVAIRRVGFIRRELDQSAPWDDVKVNQDIVMRVLAACL